MASKNGQSFQVRRLPEPQGSPQRPLGLKSRPKAPSRPLAVPAASQAFGEGETLKCGKHAIRAIPVNGVLFYALPDVLDALGLDPKVEAIVHEPDFPSYCKALSDEEDDPAVPGRPGEVVILSPVGLLYLTARTGACAGQTLVRWARKEAASRCTRLPVNDRALTLTVQPDGLLPPYPARFSGWKSDWIRLKEKNPGSNWAYRYRAAA